MWKRMQSWEAHYRLGIAAAVATVIGVVSYRYWPRAVLWVAIWNAFALMLILLSWLQMMIPDREKMRAVAKAQDFSSIVIFVVVILTCFISLFAVGYLLGTGRPDNRLLAMTHALVSILTVSISWVLIHTLFALHYAHLYYGTHQETRKGVVIPETEEPDYFDFAYLSFTIGMRYQPGGIRVVSPHLRRLIMVHGLIAFVFNTAIVALGVGCVSTLLTN